MRRTLSSIVGVLAVLAILVGIDIVADARFDRVQLDLTREKLYTLSPGTKEVLAGLKEPVTLRLYYSSALGARIPAYGAYADRVRETLSEYQRLSHGKVRLELYDPEPYSATEDRALAYGLQGVPLDRSGEQVYFGLAGTNMVDDERSIGFFQSDREPFLEYDLTQLIYELSNPTRPVVGVISSLPLDGDARTMMMAHGTNRLGEPGSPFISMIQLRQSFTVRNLDVSTPVIPADVKVLIVAHAQNLPEDTLYAIDQFVMRGGRLMAMVDPESEAQLAIPTQNGMPPADTSSDLHRLFDAWGITFDPTHVVGDLNGAWRVRAGAGDPEQAVDYLAWFNIRDGINHADPATADISQVTVATAGAIGKKPGADITLTPLLSSSAQSGEIPLSALQPEPDPAKLLADFKPSGGPRVIAARISGVLHSAFSGAPVLAKGQTRPADFPAYIAQTAKPANLVVIGDSDILADRFWVRVQDFFGQQQMAPFSDNGPFVANLVGTLSGSDALIGLRARGTSQAPFEVVDNMQRQAEARFRQTEQALQTHLDAVQKQLAELRTGRGGDSAEQQAVITPEQRKSIDALRQDVAATRAKLRAVQLDLRRDISRLETELKIADIVAVPGLLTLAAIGLGLLRRRRRAQARR